MNKLLLTLVTLGASALVAQTTMCYKENLTTPSQSETIALDGGKCSGSKSAQDMQNDGWEINDIKISSSKTGMNYTYVFKKGNISNTAVGSNLSEEELTQRIVARMNADQKQKQKEAKINRELKAIADIKSFYVKRCSECHGVNGELEARGTSRPLNTLSTDEMNLSIHGYDRDQYDRGLAFVMKPYANFATEEKIESIYHYLQSVNKK